MATKASGTLVLIIKKKRAPWGHMVKCLTCLGASALVPAPHSPHITQSTVTGVRRIMSDVKMAPSAHTMDTALFSGHVPQGLRLRWP